MHRELWLSPWMDWHALPGGSAVQSYGLASYTGDPVQHSEHPEVIMAWDKIEKKYSPTQVDMLRRLSERGPDGFHRVRSAEAAPAGNARNRPTRFKPAPPKSK